jgi:hypothetical protein
MGMLDESSFTRVGVRTFVRSAARRLNDGDALVVAT